MFTSPAPAVPFDIKDLALAERGKRRIEWAFGSMGVLQAVRKHFIKTQPFAGIRIAACLNVTAEAANLMITLRDGGGTLALCGANPLATQDDVAASLVKDYGVSVFAVKGATASSSQAHIQAVLTETPHLTLDNGCHLVNALHARPADTLESVIGGTEETTSGASRLRRLAMNGTLRYPVVALNDSETKQLFDNRYGTAQSTLDAILRSTNVLFAGLPVVVIGYGACGSGIALRARGLGAHVIVTEVDPIRALQASMDGYRVLSLADAAALGEVFITATGNKNVIGREHFEKFRNGAVLSNAGHSNVEIDLETLAHIASSRRVTGEGIEEFALRDGRRIHVLAGGQVVNLSSTAGGQPASVMDISFGNGALSAEYLVKSQRASSSPGLEKIVYPVPPDIDRQVAKLKLESMSTQIDRLTVEQEHYLANWSDAS